MRELTVTEGRDERKLMILNYDDDDDCVKRMCTLLCFT